MAANIQTLKIRFATVAAIVLLAFAGYTSVRFAWADLLRTSPDLPTVQRAIRLTPLDSRPKLREAALIAAVDPMGTEDETLLRDVTMENPRDAEAWMALGLKAELMGNNGLAEKQMLHAAELDRTFKPAWTLANFYVRAGEIDKFWHWVRICNDLVEPRNTEVLTFDPRPMFDLCWNVTQDAAVIMDRAIPRKHFILTSYLFYLLGTQRTDAALATARALFPMAIPSDYVAFINLCNSLMTARNVEGSIAVWNAMADRKLFELGALHPENGVSLTNGDLRIAPIQQGFDWRYVRPGGIYETYSAAGPYLRFDFDGDQPEHCDVFGQVVPMMRGRRYRLEYRYETSGMEAPLTGLYWRVPSAIDGKVAAAEQSSLPVGTEHGQGVFEFTSPLNQDFVTMFLRYDRAPGTVKVKGTFTLYRASLQMLP